MFLDNLHIWIICIQSVFEHRKIYVFVVKAPRGALVFPLPGNLLIQIVGKWRATRSRLIDCLNSLSVRDLPFRW